MDRVLLGETRREAIDRVQERLGPVTSRPLAEKTFWALARKGKITMDPDNGAYLIEAEIDDGDLKQEANQSIDQANKQQSRTNMSRSRSSSMRHFMLNHNSMHQARVSTSWTAKMGSSWHAKAVGILSPVYGNDDAPPAPDPDEND